MDLQYDSTLDPIAMNFDIRSWDRDRDLDEIKALAAEAEAFTQAPS